MINSADTLESDRQATSDASETVTRSPRERTPDSFPAVRPSWIGTTCGIASAVLYTLTNIALRNCVDVDAYLVSAVKAAPTVLVLGPLVGWLTIAPATSQRHSTRLAGSPSGTRQILRFILASFLAQFFGNAAFQKALQHIGLAASVPITLGVLIVGGAVLGAVLLREPVGTRKIVAMVTLIAAVVVLSLPDGFSSPITATGNVENTVSDLPLTPTDSDTDRAAGAVESQRAVDIIIGSLWAALSGLAYSFFGVTMRQTLQTGIPARNLMLISGITGTVTLWSFSFATLGYETISATSTSQWWFMIAAGFLNFSAFIAMTTALRLLPVVAVNLINASQVAMAAIAGVILFREPVTLQLAIGILLTLAGLLILARRTRSTIMITD